MKGRFGGLNPFYGKKHTNKFIEDHQVRSFNKTAKKCGFKNYQEMNADIIQFLEQTGYGPNSSETLQKYPDIAAETIRRIVIREGREDLCGNSQSSSEQELISYVRLHYRGEVIEGDRAVLGGKELDIYLPELGIAFEYNGLYWHSEKFTSGKTYHYDKYKTCLDKGVRLYTIWEHTFKERREAVLKFIKNLIRPKERIFARKCEVAEDKNKISEFIEKNHLQGSAKSSIYKALVYNGKIVMAISISKHHRNSNQWVLNRVCFSDYQVIGGLERLLKDTPRPLLTWSDNSYSPVGGMYQNAGFALDEELPLDYFYCDRNGFYTSKQSQKKSNSGCPENMTEYEFSKSKGLERIWDCGKKRWILV